MATRPITVKPAQEVLEHVFVSPRVVDRTAYEEMTAELRGLAERVGEQARALASSSAEAEAARASAAKSALDVLQRVTQAERQLGAALGRVTEASALAESAAERATRGHEAMATLASAATEHLKAFEAGCAEAVRDATQRLNTVRVDLDTRFSAVTAIAGLRMQRARVDLDAQAEAMEREATNAAERSRTAITDAVRALDADLVPRVAALRDALEDAERRADEALMRVSRLSGAELAPIEALCERLERAVTEATRAGMALAKAAAPARAATRAKPGPGRARKA
ncbi:MAG: hypothetical protein JNM80_14170 [Phycisphaerae bacterium]|nr:hypothetical protein [Phycisphaerae bacterium]